MVSFNFLILIQNVLPRQNINPYRIKMEGEGYGSDDLRNMILAALSMARCSQVRMLINIDFILPVDLTQLFYYLNLKLVRS